ncbi:MAG TPA: acyl-CoA dehydrogenase family protein [Myxococcota bacterium]|nr:acyl-CoA dehydrogenase family protein [Myxococcota bacterium]
MDFAYTEEQTAILDLAEKILADGSTKERLLELERGTAPRFDRALWKKLAEAGLLAVAVPEAHDGAGLGFLEVAGIVQRVGRTAAAVPVLETTVLGALPLARFGSAALQARWLPRVARGEVVLTAALTEPEGDPRRPSTRAAPEGDGFRLSGTKLCVPAAQIADAMLVPAATGEGRVGVFLVDAAAPGLRVTPLATTAGWPEARVDLEDVRAAAADALGDPERGAAALEWTLLRTEAALACFALGACESALRLTAEYAKTRKQFDQPLAMFQAVGHRAADAYIDLEAVRLTALQAAWRLSAELPAAKQVAVAKHFAAAAGQRIVHAAQHLHGGIGVDREYPLHRHFLAVKQLELTLGGSLPQLVRLGDLLADEPDAA